MSDHRLNIAEFIREHKRAVEAELVDHATFHQALDDKNEIGYRGFVTDRAPYSPNAHEVLIWTDPDAYVEELTFYSDDSERVKHEEVLQHITDSGQRTEFKALVKAIQRQRIVPFVGAGASVSFDFPLWGQALRDIHARIEAGIADSDPDRRLCDQALMDIIQSRFISAGKILYGLNRAQVEGYVKAKFGNLPSGSKILEEGPTRLLPKFVGGCIITTNFDEIIEAVFLKEGRPIVGNMYGAQPNHDFVPRLIAGEQCILKLHGHCENAATLVFSGRQYDDAYGSPIDYSKPLPRALRQIFVSSSLLFIGCSLEMDRTLEVFRETKVGGHFEVPTHIAILEDPNDGSKKTAKDTALRQIGIDPLWFPKGAFHFVELILEAAMADAAGRIEY